MPMRPRRGFTLIELLVVIAIIGVLAAVVLVALGAARDRANDARIKSAIGQLRRLAEVHYESNNASYAGLKECFYGAPGTIGDTPPEVDGIVDLDDLNAVRNNWGGSGPNGDNNGTGTVDNVDLNNVRDNFGGSNTWCKGGIGDAVLELRADIVEAQGLTPRRRGSRDRANATSAEYCVAAALRSAPVVYCVDSTGQTFEASTWECAESSPNCSATVPLGTNTPLPDP